MEPVAREMIVDRIEHFDALDPISEPLQKVVRAVVPERSLLKDALSGTWLGHPAHPPLTDAVIGAWTSALLLDVLGGDGANDAADKLVAAGILAAVPTAAAGLSDWADVRGPARRVGSIHAIGNTTALTLNVLSWRARRRGERSRGVGLSALAYAVATVSAWLGGHLSFGLGVGVNQTAFEDAPSEWVPVADEAQVPDRKLVGARANGVGVVLARAGGRIHALSDRCSHRGCPLHEGAFDGETITCRCHGSTFRLDGSIVTGPATSPQPAFEVRTSNGKIEVRRSE